MGRLLTSDEKKVLAGISGLMTGLVDQGTQVALAATGVLDGIGANPNDYVLFQQRFARLQARLDELS